MSQLIAQYLNSLGRYEVVGIAHDGERGLQLIRSNPVDVAVIDLVLPGKDGFYVLDELSRNKDTKPVCIVLSGISHSHITAKAIEKGADYFMLKPFDLELLGKRIGEVWDQKHVDASLSQPAPPLACKDGPESFILRVLHDMPIANTLNGYTYIKSAVLLAIEDPSMLEGITKRLYPAVAKRAGTTGPQVERAIRHAISTAWRKGGGRSFAAIVGYGDPNSPKPTNSAFITALVELYIQRHDG